MFKLPKNWGRLGWGVDDALETRYFPTGVITPNFLALGQTI